MKGYWIVKVNVLNPGSQYNTPPTLNISGVGTGAVLVPIMSNGTISDVGVAALCARSAVIGGYLNVLINIKDYNNTRKKKKLLKKAEDIKEQAIKQENIIIKKTLKKIR